MPPNAARAAQEARNRGGNNPQPGRNRTETSPEATKTSLRSPASCGFCQTNGLLAVLSDSHGPLNHVNVMVRADKLDIP